MTTRRYATITMDCALDVDDGVGEGELEDVVRSLCYDLNPHGGGVEVYNPDRVEVEIVPDDEPQEDE